MSSGFAHPYNPDGSIAYFLTFRCYGTWLHGDSRGSVDRNQHNAWGLDPIPEIILREKYEIRCMKEKPVSFDERCREIIQSSIRQVCKYNDWQLHALSVMSNHVHIVLSAPIAPEKVMLSLKAWCTRALRQEGLFAQNKRIWSRHGSTKYVWTAEELERVCHYAVEGQMGT